VVRNITSENINIQRTLLALLALVLAGVLFAVWPNPADAATIFTVNKTGDAGDRKITDTVCDSSRLRGKQCTLRAAIEEANDTSGADTINFAIGGTASVKTILPDSELPEITDPVTIDGYSQRGAKANTLAEGKNAVLKMEINVGRAEPPVAGLVIRTSNNHFNGPGVLISDSDATATDNKIEANFLGTRPDGSTGFGNSTGVAISGASNTPSVGRLARRAT
jgi:CSLREA domain-containing protein